MTTYDIPARTVKRIKVGNPKLRFKWDRDETPAVIKTNIEVRGYTVIATNYTTKPATLTLSDLTA